MLTLSERLRVDAAGSELYLALHRDTIDEVVRDVRERRARAIVVSVARCSLPDAWRVVNRVASIVRDFPCVKAVALLTDVAGVAPATVLMLGQCGIRTLIDARYPAGWRALRDALVPAIDDCASRLEGIAVARLDLDLRLAPSDCRRFFTMLFTGSPVVTTVRALAHCLRVVPTTLVSRFARHRLPSPKAYLATARLTRAAALFEDPGMSVAAVAATLEYSSPQAFSRHLRHRLGITPSTFRRRYDGEGMLDHFRHHLVLDHLDRFRTFSPLSPPSIANGVRDPARG
jgi:AraC-like DNA-binding protein